LSAHTDFSNLVGRCASQHALIRIFDYAGAYGYDLQGAVDEKLAYNAKREDHKASSRLAEGGKKF
jgi:hypothetical protein